MYSVTYWKPLTKLQAMQKITTLLIALLFISCSGLTDKNISELHISSLLCENQDNPNHIDQASPRLSWQMSSEKKGQSQTAYRILVASSPDLLTEKKADLWDSGKIMSPASVFIPYNGRELKSGQKYYFTVKVWDKDGIPSEYAKPAFWEMALLNKEDWQAKWISAPRVFDWGKRDAAIKRAPQDSPAPQDPLPLFRKSFVIDKKVKSAKAYISGLGFFELYANGEKIGDHILSPAFTDYSKTVLYEVLDLTTYLKHGENALGVMLGNGWYNQVSNDVWSFSRAPWIADPTVLCQLEIEFTDGSKQQVLSDESWKCAPGPIMFSSIRLGETYDATNETEGWNQPGFNQQGWQEVRVVRGPEGKLKAQNIPPVKIMDELNPKNITRIGKNTFIVDFGQNMSGFIKLTASGEKGRKISFRYAEKLTPDGKLDQANIANLVGNSRFQTDEYIFKGGGTEEWHPRFSYNGFRYVEVSGWEGPLNEGNLTACFIHTGFKTTGKFKCSLPLLNRIQENTLWSFESNFVNIPTDCPQREKNGWTGDAQLASETGLFNYNMLTSYEKWVNDIIDAQKPDGILPGIVPTSGWGFHWGNGPAWDCALLQIPWNLYLYEGDRRIIANAYPSIKKYLEFLSTKSEKGIVKWGLGDWCPARAKTPAELTSTAYYYQDLLIASKMAALLGAPEEQSAFLAKAAEIKTAFNREFFAPQSGELINPTQTALGCALFMQIADSSKTKRLAAELKEAVTTSDYNLDFGILGAKYVPNALSAYGYKDVAFSIINTTRYPGWGNWVERGATTLWEDWDGKSSLNHIMFGDVSAWFYKNLAGISPDEKSPGFKHFNIEPYFAPGLKWVKGVKGTRYGDIDVYWSKSGKEINLKLKIPVNTTASVLLPPGNLLIDGKIPEAGKEGIIQFEFIKKKNKLELGSGTYNIRL
ncbi:Alfa-L-rhamnosidase [hydrothermal vent metagenome]|uniref:alpha-L-rhamnosidase n=1 Tax=hydrothermal vent metagenome TaxID=652676 RepID=A0A3B0TV78_9ZZZZ